MVNGKAIVRERVEKIDGVSRTWFEWLSRDSTMAKTLVVEIEFDTDVRGGDKVFHWSGGDLRPRRSKIQPVVRRSFVLWTKGSRRDVCRGSLRGGSAICFQ